MYIATQRSDLVRERENPNWSFNLSFVTGLRRIAAEKSPAPEEIDRARGRFLPAPFTAVGLLPLSFRFVRIRVVFVVVVEGFECARSLIYLKRPLNRRPFVRSGYRRDSAAICIRRSERVVLSRFSYWNVLHLSIYFTASFYRLEN